MRLMLQRSALFLLVLCFLAVPFQGQDQDPVPESPKFQAVVVLWTEQVATGRRADISWIAPDPVPGADVTQYRIYRATAANGKFLQRGAVAVPKTSWSDSTVVSGKTYWYRLTSLATRGRESEPSVAVAVTIP